MDRSGGERPTFTRRQRAALRALLIKATAIAGRHPGSGDELSAMVAAAPIHGLPAAAALHRVAGSVLRGLDGAEGVPGDVRAELLALRTRSSFHHLLITGALGRIGQAFDEADIAWSVMKGPVVAARLYPETGDRTYGDLDVLVDRRHFPRAIAILEEQGFHHHIHNWALAERMLAGEIQLSSDVVVVDVHWHLHYSPYDRRPFALDPEAMIRRGRPVVVSGVTVPTLDPVDTLVTLGFHAARSDGHRLVWLKDIERAVAVDEPDFDELVRRCRAYRCAPSVGLVLRRAAALLDAAIPDDVIRAIVPPSLRVSERAALALAHPVQLHERATVTRVFTRSVRSSLTATVAAAPGRGVRRLQRHLFPPPENETDDLTEKQRYLAAVSASTGQ